MPTIRWPWLVLLAGACLPLARVLVDPLGALPGSEAGDVYKHAWPYWHTLAQLRDGTWPYTDYLNAPDGGLLLDVMVLPSLLLAPVSLVAGPVLPTNLLVLGSLLGVGAATYGLCKHLTRSTTGSLCAALVVQTSPFLLGYALTSGVHERLSLWIFPLVVLGLLRIRQGAGWRWPPLLAAGALFSFSQCPTYGLFTGVLLLLMLPLLLWRPRAYSRVGLLRMALAYGGLGLVMAGIYAVYSWFVLEPTFLAGIPQGRVTPTIGVGSAIVDLPQDVATLGTLFNPWTVRASRPMEVDDELFRMVYIGWVPLLAMLAGLVAAWRKRQRTALAVAGVGFTFLALSLGQTVSVGGWSVENPFHFVVSYLMPFFGGVPSTRQLAGVAVALGVVALCALVSALPSRRWRLAAAGLLLLGTLAERALVLPVPVVLNAAPARPGEVYGAVGDRGSLVDIPRLWPGNMVSRGAIFLAQTRHHRPVPLAINLGIARLDDYRPVTRGEAPDWARAAACLRHNKTRWVVVHRKWFADPAAASRCVEGLRRAVGRPRVDRDGALLFDLAALPASAVSLGQDCPRGPRFQRSGAAAGLPRRQPDRKIGR